MAVNREPPGEGARRRATDATREALTEQIYEGVYRPLLDELLAWSRDNNPEIYYKFCSLWQNHAFVMRNEVAFFSQIFEWASSFIPMPEVWRRTVEGGLGHLPVATRWFMERHLHDVQYPPDFRPASLAESLKVTWQFMTGGRVLDRHWPVLERLRRAFSRETVDVAQQYGSYAVRGLGRGFEVAHQAYEARWAEIQLERDTRRQNRKERIISILSNRWFRRGVIALGIIIIALYTLIRVIH